MNYLRKIISIISVATLFGCGGGGDSAPVVATANGTAVSLTAFKGQLYGTAPAGQTSTFLLTGSDSQGSSWSGSMSIVSDGATTFEGQNVTKSHATTTLTRSGSAPESNTITRYFALLGSNIYKFIDVNGVAYTATAETMLPDIAHVGDADNMFTLTNGSGITQTVTWRLDPEYNGNSKLVISAIIRDVLDVITGTEVDTYYFDSTGNAYRFTVATTVNGITLNLSGNKL